MQEFMRYEVLKEFGRDEAAARRHYRAYVHACLTDDDGPLLDALAANRFAIGGESFLEETEERIERRRSGEGARPRLRPAAAGGFAARHRRGGGALFRRSATAARGCSTVSTAGAAKAVAVELACGGLADQTGRAVGQHYGISSTGVGAIHRRVADRPGVLVVAAKLATSLQRRRRK